MAIPFVDLKLQHEQVRGEIRDAIERVITNSSFVLGPEVAAFESAFAAYVGSRYAVGTASGTSALQVALLALGVGRGHEVIVPAMTFYATAEAAALLGARPVFVDIDPITFTLDVDQVEGRLSDRTRAVIPVHLYGHPSDMRSLASVVRERGVPILEDCAHAHGADYAGRRVGGWGAIGAFSFYPGKNLGALGEAGGITTNDEALARRCQAFRDHGSVRKFEHDLVGMNARMSGLQAAVLGVKLNRLDAWNHERRQIATTYRELLQDENIELPRVRGDVEHVYHVFQVQVENRDEVLRRMREYEIGVNLHYPVPMHLHPGFAFLEYERGAFPNAERLAARTLSLPCYPGMTRSQIERTAECLRDSVRRAA